MPERYRRLTQAKLDVLRETGSPDERRVARQEQQRRRETLDRWMREFDDDVVATLADEPPWNLLGAYIDRAAEAGYGWALDEDIVAAAARERDRRRRARASAEETREVFRVVNL